MRTIKLKALSLVNFKGQRDLTIQFSDKETFVCGKNATGKTTVFDSFLWLLFGKDSTGRSDSNFNIKTLDENGTPILHLEHSVTGVLDVDGVETKLQRKYVEKWVKPSGTTEETLQNHVTQFYLNDVKLGTKKEYDAAVAAIMPEDVAKMITNPFYFTALPADTQKDMLLDMSGNITDDEIAALDPSYLQLLATLNGRPLEQYNKEISAKKKAIKDELIVIPSQIDTANRLKPQAENWDALNTELDSKKKEIKKIDAKLADKTKIGDSAMEAKTALIGALGKLNVSLEQRKNDIIISAEKVYNDALLKANNEKSIQEKNIQEKLTSIKSQINNRRNEIKMEHGFDRVVATNDINTLQNEIRILEANRNTLMAEKAHLEKDAASLNAEHAEWVRKAESLQAEVEKLRNEYKVIYADAPKIDNTAFICPTCKRPLEADDVESKMKEIQENFNLQKADRLKHNKENGIRTSQAYKASVSAADDIASALSQLTSKKIANEEELKANYNEISIKKQTLISKQASLPAEPNWNELEANDATIQSCMREYQEAQAIKVDVVMPVKPDHSVVVSQDQDCIDLQNRIVDLHNQIDNFKVQVDADGVAELEEKKQVLNQEIQDLITRLANKATIERADKEINDLEEKRISANQALADLERMEMVVFNFQRDKDKELLNRINGMFKLVSFKFESAQLNGGSKLTCICTVNGVPYPDVNAAGKLQAGLDIINAICTHKGITAPIFIDNREGVNDIGDCVSQIINLCVTTDKALNIK